MGPIRMDESVGDESPYIRAATRQTVTQYNRAVVAYGNKSKTKQKFDVLLLAKHKRAHDVHKHQHSHDCDDHWRDIEKWLALHEKVRWGTTELRRFATRPQALYGRKNKGGLFALPQQVGLLASLESSSGRPRPRSRRRRFERSVPSSGECHKAVRLPAFFWLGTGLRVLVQQRIEVTK